MKKTVFFLAAALLIFSVFQTYGLIPKLDFLKNVSSFSLKQSLPGKETATQKVVYEESVITRVVEDSLPSVVTIGIKKTTTSQGFFEFNPFDPFGGIRRIPGRKEQIDQNIGSGFIVSKDGLIITNKHVVSDTEATYQVLTNDNKEYDVDKIYRDPLNDLAILKINTTGLKALSFGDSSKLKLGQMAIAIGTPLGEFRNTVTTGIISGLGRGITAGSPFEGFVEKLDNVIQTDAAISPGNSGGPLLNSSGQVIGVNAAIAQEGQNIGFAIPVNVVKELLDEFDKRGGSFERAYLGVRYQIIDKKTAIMNSLPEGAYVESVVEGSPAEKAGILADDIIVQINGAKIGGEGKEDMAALIAKMKVGEQIQVTLYRNGEEKEVRVTLDASE